jgi:hypothetical protein
MTFSLRCRLNHVAILGERRPRNVQQVVDVHRSWSVDPVNMREDAVHRRRYPPILTADDAARVENGQAATRVVVDPGPGVGVAADALTRLGPLDCPLRMAQFAQRVEVMGSVGLHVTAHDFLVRSFGHLQTDQLVGTNGTAPA